MLFRYKSDKKEKFVHLQTYHSVLNKIKSLCKTLGGPRSFYFGGIIHKNGMEWLWYKALGNSMQLWYFCMHRFVYMFMCRGYTGIHLHICKSVWRPKDQMSSLQWDRPCFQMSLTGLEFVKLLKLLDQWTQRCAYLCVPSKFLPLWQVILVWALGLQLSLLCL